MGSRNKHRTWLQHGFRIGCKPRPRGITCCTVQEKALASGSPTARDSEAQPNSNSNSGSGSEQDLSTDTAAAQASGRDSVSQTAKATALGLHPAKVPHKVADLDPAAATAKVAELDSATAAAKTAELGSATATVKAAELDSATATATAKEEVDMPHDTHNTAQLPFWKRYPFMSNNKAQDNKAQDNTPQQPTDPNPWAWRFDSNTGYLRTGIQLPGLPKYTQDEAIMLTYCDPDPARRFGSALHHALTEETLIGTLHSLPSLRHAIIKRLKQHMNERDRANERALQALRIDDGVWTPPGLTLTPGCRHCGKS